MLRFTWPPIGQVELQRSLCPGHPAQEVVSLKVKKSHTLISELKCIHLEYTELEEKFGE